ncbi:hypothetical protein SASPL_128048 [Salvia splendens]|uniref:GDSL esterase/lipase n=1 Tax=Salvia splendens TaxID=180675 RepID=A0A8X8XAT2_SALSN|nr:hypothetical protein SASPL_128048 [Salvia splendens]
MFIACVTLSMLVFHAASQCSRKPVIFNFGDSNSDTGCLAAAMGYEFGYPDSFIAPPVACYKNLVGEDGFKNAIYMIDIGQNDLTPAFNNVPYDQVLQKIPSFISEIKEAMWCLTTSIQRKSVGMQGSACVRKGQGQGQGPT